jgi:hypothetical protein
LNAERLNAEAAAPKDILCAAAEQVLLLNAAHTR